MTDYKECSKKSINGRTRVLYTKPGSTKKYLKHKGRMMSLVNYKKMCANKETVTKPKKRVRRGGNLDANIQNMSSQFAKLFNQDPK